MVLQSRSLSDCGWSERSPSGRASGWRDVRCTEYRDRAAFGVNFGRVTLRVAIATPGAFTIWRASTPDAPPNRREGLYLETQGTSTTFTTTFEPVPPL